MQCHVTAAHSVKNPFLSSRRGRGSWSGVPVLSVPQVRALRARGSFRPFAPYRRSVRADLVPSQFREERILVPGAPHRVAMENPPLHLQLVAMRLRLPLRALGSESLLNCRGPLQRPRARVRVAIRATPAHRIPYGYCGLPIVDLCSLPNAKRTFGTIELMCVLTQVPFETRLDTQLICSR